MSDALRRSAVFLWSDRALFVGDRSETATHEHHAIEISLALDDAGVEVASGSTCLDAAPGVVVRSNVPHSLSIPGPKVAVLYVEPLAPLGAGLEAWLGDRDIAPLPGDLVGRCRGAFVDLFQSGRDLGDGRRACDAVLHALVREPPRAPIDPRIKRAMALLLERLDAPPPQAEVAAAAKMSASRFNHLFKAEVGLPMRRWILWMRLRAALLRVLSRGSMAEAAHDAGFSDAAHFTRTCARMFGLPPTAFAPVDALFVEA